MLDGCLVPQAAPNYCPRALSANCSWENIEWFQAPRQLVLRQRLPVIAFAPTPVRHGDERGDQIGAGHTAAVLLLEHATNISEEHGAIAWFLLNTARR